MHKYTTHELRTRAQFLFDEWQVGRWKTYRLLVTFVMFPPLCFWAISSLFSLCIFLFLSPFWPLVVWLHLYIVFNFSRIASDTTIDGGGWWTVYFVNKAYLSGFWKLMTLRKVLFPLFYSKHTFPLLPISQCPSCSYSLPPHTMLLLVLLSATYVLALFFPFLFFILLFLSFSSTEYSLCSH